MTAELEQDLTDAITVALSRVLLEARTITPAEVIEYRSGPPEFCKVQPALNRQLRDGQVIRMPAIDRVPILWPGNSDFTSGVDLRPGDEVCLLVSDRAIDQWIAGGGRQTPSVGRVHDMSDAIAVPGLASAKTAPTVRRGARTHYTGTRDGTAPWMRLDKGPGLPTASIEAEDIRLGENATLGVARTTDAIQANATMAAWMTAVTAALNTLVGGIPLPPIPPGSFGTISGGSTKVKSE